MKRILIFAISALVSVGYARAAVRDGNAAARSKSSTSTTSQRATTTEKTPTARTSVLTPRTSTSARTASPQRTQQTVSSRAATTTTASSGTTTRTASPRAATNKVTTRTASAPSIVSRAAENIVNIAETRTGAAYEQCKNAFFTCMDQFCAKANDTYRRCFCSSKFEEFRDTENALDEAKSLLMRFEDNNLNAVDKSAAEVDAMYSATVGEMAIKNDTSAAAATLSEIGDLLSGKKKAQTNNTSGSLGILSLDFTEDVDDIWSGSGGSSIFNTGSGEDLSALEGQKLFNSANNQCLKMISESCENNAVLTMARSAYNIMITQDCNAYEKKINSQREAVKQTVRQAEKMLRDARLEEYRNHNTADVNECLAKVRTALTQDTACGANYKRCLDYSGVYINSNTGEAIYSPRLFKLVEQINLDGSSDVLGQNPQFNQFLDSKKMFATTALDTCRDISDIVWQEFKRAALIEISQAQDEKIEEIKMSCVNTMADCYDTQSSALKSFDNTTSQYSGAQAAYAARTMCQDKVAACAALYAGPNDTECKFDNNGRLTNGAVCGLTALVNFVQTVDNVRVAEGCSIALDNKMKEICTPAKDTRGYPWNCSVMSRDELKSTVEKYAQLYCADPASNGQDLAAETQSTVNKIIDSIYEELDYQLMESCEELDGYWVATGDVMQEELSGKLLSAFYANNFGGRTGDTETSYGRCVENDTMVQCISYNSGKEEQVATYDRSKDICIFTDEWYKMKCETMQGYYENSVCYVAK